MPMLISKALVVLALVSGLGGGRTDGPGLEAREGAPRCPGWFDQAPRLGSGLPVPVPVQGLRKVTVCRYLHAFSGEEVIHHPPIKSDLQSVQTIAHKAGVRSLATLFNRLEPYAAFEQEALNCPIESTGGFYFRFQYQSGRDVSVQVIPSGCPRAVAGRKGKVLVLGKNDLRRVATLALP
jgi:hypothetical protein